MAKKKRSAAGPRKRRPRRTAEEMIADLQEQIRRVRSRQKARELKSSPSMKAGMNALRWIDKALDIAADEGNAGLRHALADARRALGSHLERQGLDLPKANLPKGPRPKTDK